MLAAGEPPPEISLYEARKLLNEIIAEFRHTTPADRARHLATIITPALVLGGLLGFTAMASLGLPGLAGFWGEFMALLGAFNAAHRSIKEAIKRFRTLFKEKAK